ncbi:hypothetical protein GWK47_041310 [Chionoecetes opilio]|uniref:Uncharacterized protein n=1 Tax=Chionoecetes opilio TaxID=41210 RepID=A0A8J4YCJ4_CHIOP|nr:hypothetical protein GWK47_041310 [Chionoecetes opilio]
MHTVSVSLPKVSKKMESVPMEACFIADKYAISNRAVTELAAAFRKDGGKNLEEYNLSFNDHPLDTSRIGALVFDTTAVKLWVSGVESSFVKLPVAQWTTSDNYRHGKKVVANLPVVNDAAERALGLATDLNTTRPPNLKSSSRHYTEL